MKKLICLVLTSCLAFFAVAEPSLKLCSVDEYDLEVKRIVHNMDFNVEYDFDSSIEIPDQILLFDDIALIFNSSQNYVRIYSVDSKVYTREVVESIMNTQLFDGTLIKPV